MELCDEECGEYGGSGRARRYDSTDREYQQNVERWSVKCGEYNHRTLFHSSIALAIYHTIGFTRQFGYDRRSEPFDRLNS